jgi:hypothetical protein
MLAAIDPFQTQSDIWGIVLRACPNPGLMENGGFNQDDD